MLSETTEKNHADCVSTAINIATKHPYFLTNLEHDSSSINFVDKLLETEDWKNPAFGVFFKTKNGEADRDTTFALMITKIIKERGFYPDGDEYETEHFEIVLVKKQSCEQSDYHLVYKKSANYLTTGVTVIAMFYLALCPDMIVALEYGCNVYNTPKHWSKSFTKTIDRYCVGWSRSAGDKYRNPAFYPKGTIVEFSNLRPENDARFNAQYTVTDVAVNKPDSYILCTDRYVERHSKLIDPRENINIGHVTKIVKRGDGPQVGVSTAHSIYNRQRNKSPTGGMSYYECQKKAESRLNFNFGMKHARLSDGYETPADWFAEYIMTFKSGKLDYNFPTQFDGWAFLKAVSNFDEITDPGDFKLDHKKFKKQIKRAHCYLRKLRHVVRGDAIEEEHYYEDANYRF